MSDEVREEHVDKPDNRGLVAEALEKVLDTENVIGSQNLRLYRSLTGVGMNKEGLWIHKGINQDRLRKYGAFNVNLSWDQFYEGLSRRVIGLPVSLNAREAIMWLENKRYQEPPAIVVLEVPIDYFSDSEGTLKLTRNGEEEKFDVQITQDMIQGHVDGSRKLEGECFLTGQNSSQVPDSIRNFEKIIVPKKLNPDGTIDFPSGFEELKLK